LGKVLNEISGLAYYKKNESLLAISDSKEKIIEINLRKEKLKDFTSNVMPSGQDGEDLVLLDSTVYVLASKGIIRSFPVNAHEDSVVQSYSMGLPGKNDFETLYYDSLAKSLILLCKTCETDKDKHKKSAYRFDLDGKKFDSAVYYTISTQSVKDFLKDTDADFKPSAAAIHPVEKRLYILSSAGQLLVIADLEGNILEAYKLHPDLYPQAEGIAFAPDGTMYISNEGKFGKPFLLKFPYRGKGTVARKNK
jgi:uncharacterized protein YjiK